MIGIVVVTHGQVAEELVNAARTIVGEIPAIAAVSIGWSDDPAEANAAIEKGLEDVGNGEAVILTDMFGGTPTNLSLPYLSPEVEIITGVNLPMIIKATALRDGVLPHVAREIRDQGKGAIYVASEVLEKEP
ncbi:MAG: PTS sugar transporter subunit IIA [Acidobacteria bacterium]|jgi:PTS system mannose-specific IIA component|nr:PTS sugar transporter subunit IIA [Acidobacteriota bacterium]